MDAGLFDKLNPQQLAAATHDAASALLIIAGAGTGKTNTLAHRVAWHLQQGVDPSRILLLTFTRRASVEMLKRVEGIVEKKRSRTASPISRIWGGTFHAIANRLLRMYSKSLGLSETFVVMDRADSEDLIHTIRAELELDKSNARFPRKATAMAIYSRCVNAQEKVEAALKTHFPWCQDFPDQLKLLFRTYAERKLQQNLLDYDDLLLFWQHLMQDDAIAADIRRRFDAILVDEYQDTNALQADILRRLSPSGKGVTVVGDDAQAIYSFRAASISNILDFPKTFTGAAVVKLEHNYRSVQPILDATNHIIAQAKNRFAKDLFSTRQSAQKPRLVTVVDEDQQCGYIVDRVLYHLESGTPLHKQAVLFRAAHHSDALEVELARKNIPFVKYGGLKFLEAAHVKDLLCFLRLAENPRDSISAYRVLQLLDGFGPAHTKRAVAHLQDAQTRVEDWKHFTPPAAAMAQWPMFCALMLNVSKNDLPLAEQVSQIAKFYAPLLERKYDHPDIRARDLDQLEQIANSFTSRSQMLSELALDPPNSTQDLAGPPLREEDYLILSTIHSAKGCEWDSVYVIHAADGNIPSDMATGSDEEIEEERRLFYVACTRARDFLEVICPLKYYHKKWATSDRHSFAQLTRFLTTETQQLFERADLRPAEKQDAKPELTISADLQKKVQSLWS